MHTIKWATLLSVFWLLLSGYIQPLLLSFGIVSVILVVFVLKRMDTQDAEPQKLGSVWVMLRYFSWLLGQIAISSMHVTKLIWSPARELSPSLAKIPVKNVPKDSRVLYANSITLTPGTLSVDMQDDEITVHALEQSSIVELNDGSMEKKITSLWGEQKGEEK